jgi:hypothetical protein
MVMNAYEFCDRMQGILPNSSEEYCCFHIKVSRNVVLCVFLKKEEAASSFLNARNYLKYGQCMDLKLAACYTRISVTCTQNFVFSWTRIQKTVSLNNNFFSPRASRKCMNHILFK